MPITTIVIDYQIHFYGGGLDGSYRSLWNGSRGHGSWPTLTMMIIIMAVLLHEEVRD